MTALVFIGISCVCSVYRCPVDSDVLSLHDMEMEAAANKAKEEYLREHPEQNPELDTEKLLSKCKSLLLQPTTHTCLFYCT